MASNEKDATTMEESEPTEIDATASTSVSTPTRKKSPPGMKLRSGRKKRRRSKETTGLTPDQDGAPAKRKRTGQEQQQESDESMSDADEEEESVEDLVEAATKAAAAAISKPERKEPKKLDPIQKLRMPSQHTPGQTAKKPRANKTTISIEASSPAGTAALASTVAIGAPPPAVAAAGTRKLLFGGEATTAPLTTTPASEELESILANPPPPSHPGPSPTTPQGRHDALPRNFVRRTSDILMDFTSNIQEVTTNLVVPQPERMHLQNDNNNHHDNEGLLNKSKMMMMMPPLDRTLTWMGMFLLLHVLVAFAYPLGFNPIGGAVVGLSNLGVSVYHGSRNNTAVSVVEPTVSEKVPVDIASNDEEEGDENPLELFMESLEESVDAMRDNTTLLHKQLDHVKETLASRKVEFVLLQGLMDKTEKSFSNLLQLASAGHQDKKLNIRGASLIMKKLEHKLMAHNNMLGSALKSSPFPPLVDVGAVSLWDETPVPCLKSSPTSQDSILTPEELKLQSQDLRQRANDAAKLLRTDPEMSASIKKWVRDQVKTVLAQQSKQDHSVEETTASVKTLNKGLTDDALEGVIQSRLEREMADRLGRIDHASLARGASIVTTGPRATSPSLVDNLPLVNRLAAKWRLRFYGHGPEAALTPTHPVDALGQCWSFDAPMPKPSKDDARGEFGTLTVQLPKPVTVTSVVVEHVPKELTKQIRSAPREFRVLGYEDPQATGKPWWLGSFEYDIHADRALQEFDTETETERGVPIPKLGAVSLAIDTNHGFDYTCLYRFRVHGEP